MQPQDRVTGGNGTCAAITALRHITDEQLRHLGARQVVYLKAGTCDGEQAFVVFGADVTRVFFDCLNAAPDPAAHRAGNRTFDRLAAARLAWLS